MRRNGTARRGFRRRRSPSSASSALWACWCRRNMAGPAPTMSAMPWRSRRSPPATARSRRSSACRTRSAACRYCNTARRSRNSGFCVPMARGEMLACFCLTEPQAGSDAAAIKTRARRHGNRWVLERHQAVHHLGQERRGRDRLRGHRPRSAARGASAPLSCRPTAPATASRGSSTSSASAPPTPRSSSSRISS